MSPVTTIIPGWLVTLTVDGTMKLASIVADTRTEQAAIATRTTAVLRLIVTNVLDFGFVEFFSKLSTETEKYRQG
jgi:hypothetical protein